MATIGATFLNLADHMQRRDPDGSRAVIIERVRKTNSAIKDIPFREGNLENGHRFVTRSGAPAVAWRVFNQGVSPTKSRTGAVTETTGMLSAMSQIDVQLAKSGGDPIGERAAEDAAFMPALEEESEAAIFYASTKVNPEKPLGIAPRLDSTTGPYGNQILLSALSGAASGADQTSVYLVVWGENTAHGIFPKGSNGGLEMIDHGASLQEDGITAGAKINVYTTEWIWKWGICLKDPRYIARLANIDTGNILTTGRQLILDLIKLTYKVKDLTAGKPVLYMNRNLLMTLDLQRFDTSISGGGINWENIDGKRVPMFRGIPIHMTDAVLSTEAKIS